MNVQIGSLVGRRYFLLRYRGRHFWSREICEMWDVIMISRVQKCVTACFLTLRLTWPDTQRMTQRECHKQTERVGCHREIETLVSNPCEVASNPSPTDSIRTLHMPWHRMFPHPLHSIR
jgi:hypothetical protein